MRAISFGRIAFLCIMHLHNLTRLLHRPGVGALGEGFAQAAVLIVFFVPGTGWSANEILDFSQLDAIVEEVLL